MDFEVAIAYLDTPVAVATGAGAPATGRAGAVASGPPGPLIVALSEN